jgi:hypothetical protein
LETLTSVTIRDIDDQDLYRLVNAAFVSLRDGLDMMEEVQHRLVAQASKAISIVSRLTICEFSFAQKSRRSA